MRSREYLSAVVDSITAACDEPFDPQTPIVYFLQAGDDGPIKIGYCARSDNFRMRIMSLQTGCPWPLTIRRIMEAKDRRITETELHERFSQFRLTGEWFAPCAELIELSKGKAGPQMYAQPITKAYERGFKAGLRKGEADAYVEVSVELMRFAKVYGSQHDYDVTVGTIGIPQDEAA